MKDLQALHSLGHAIDAIIPIDAVPGTGYNQRSPDNSKAVSFNDEEIQLVLKDELQLAVRSQEIAAFEETVMTEEVRKSSFVKIEIRRWCWILL